MPGAPSSFLLLVAFLFLAVRPGAPSSVLAPSSFLLLVATGEEEVPRGVLRGSLDLCRVRGH